MSTGRRPRKSARRSFYARVLEEAELSGQLDAAAVSGLDDEVVVLRVILRRLLEERPDEVKLQLATIDALARVLKTRYQLSTEQKNTLKEALLKTLTEVAIPLGIKFLPGPK